MANEIAKTNKNEVAQKSIADYLAIPAVKEQIDNVLGADNSASFVSDVVACVQNNAQIAQCTNASIFSGALVARTLNLSLSPTLGYAYLVPFDVRRKDGTYDKVAQYQMGYKGYVQLALRSGNYFKLVATDVRKGEVVNYDPFEDTYTLAPVEFEKRIAKDNKGNYIVPIIGYYAKFKLNNGFTKELFMSHEDMLAYAKKYSKAYRSDLDKHTSYSFWTSRFEDMAKKTMLRQLLSKWGLLTSELQRAYECDMAVMDENGNPEYLDNQPDDVRESDNPISYEELAKDIEAMDAPFREVD